MIYPGCNTNATPFVLLRRVQPSEWVDLARHSGDRIERETKDGVQVRNAGRRIRSDGLVEGMRSDNFRRLLDVYPSRHEQEKAGIQDAHEKA